MKLFFILILSTSIPLNAAVLWCESEESIWKTVVHLSDNFKKKSSTNSTIRGTICQKAMWFSDKGINTAITGKYDKYNPSIETWLKLAKKKNSLYCNTGSKESTYYSWLDTSYHHMIDRKSLELTTRERVAPMIKRSLNCSVSSENEVKSKWKELENMQIITNKKISEENESENII